MAISLSTVTGTQLIAAFARFSGIRVKVSAAIHAVCLRVRGRLTLCLCGIRNDRNDTYRKASNQAHGNLPRAMGRRAILSKDRRLIVDDVTSVIAQVYPLYLQVYQRSKLHFEKLTEQYFCELGHRMRDKVRFFLWRQSGRIIAFATCMIQDDEIYAEYIGLDYDIALDLHLYHYAFRDMVSWAIDNGYRWFRSSGLNYDPKLHLRHLLDPIDLYVRHTSGPINAIMRRFLPLLEPTRYDETLAKFSNYHELWATR
jgi:GNAT acetyltransferase-like protein